MADNSNERKNVSKHILPTSSNLLGLCFILLSLLKLSKLHKSIDILIDKFIGIPIVLFLIASAFSYMSMRAKRNEAFYEKVADIIFLVGLFSITVISIIMIVFEVL